MIANERVKTGRVPIRHAAIEARRRTRRLAPGAVVLSLLMVVGVLAVVAPGSAMASPLYTYGPFFAVTSTWVNATSVQINYTGACAFPSGSFPIIVWGNTTNPSAYSQPAPFNNNTLTGKIPLNYLEPSTTYDFELTHGLGHCPNQPNRIFTQTYVGSFTTSIWPVENVEWHHPSQLLWINGTVTSGSNAAPSNFEVEVACLGAYSNYYVAAWTGAYINGQRLPNDAFAIPVYNVPPQYDLPCVDNMDPFVVQVVNDAYNSADWVGYWNESLVLFSPQVVNFQLPTNFVGPYVPEVLDFGNFTTGYGEIQYVNTTTTTSIETSQWSVSGGVGVGPGTFSGEYTGSTEVTASISSGHGYFSTNGPLDAGCTSDTTGMVQFNALYRTWNVTAQYSDGTHAACGHSVQSFGIQPPTNWLTPGNVGAAGRDIYYVMNDGVPMVGQPEGGGQGTSGFVQASTTVAYTNGYDISFGLDQTIPLLGAPSFSFTGTLGWSHTSSTTYSTSLEWTIGGTGMNNECYDVIGQGGSATGNTADMISIIMYTPSGVLPSGQVECSPTGL